MKYTLACTALFVIIGTSHAQGPAAPSAEAATQSISAGKAFALSLVLPGLGHRYARGGDWDGWASIFAVADAGLWAGLLGAEWRQGQVVESYETLAATRAQADVEGKGRDFFLSLASYMSAEEYRDAQLRSRNWSRIGFAEDPANFWEWASEEDFQRFRSLRGDAESLKRRRTFIITSLVANRLISGFAALRSAHRANAELPAVTLGIPPAGSSVPMVHLTIRW